MSSLLTPFILTGRALTGPGPITTVEAYFDHWAAAGALLDWANAPDTATADRITARNTAEQLIAETKQVLNNPELHRAVTEYVVALLEERGRAEGWIK